MVPKDVAEKPCALSSSPKGRGRPKKSDDNLDVRQIVAAAWAIVDAEGVAKLSTRSLAAALNIQSPALYWHVKDKEQLFSLMVDNMLEDSLRDCPADVSWQDWLRTIGRRQRSLLMAHRDGGIIASMAPSTERLREELFPCIYAPLVAAGIRVEDAGTTAGALASLVLGWVLYEQRNEVREFMETMQDTTRSFEFALDSLIDGLSGRLESERRNSD